MEPLALLFSFYSLISFGLDLIEDFFVLDDVVAIDILIIKFLRLELKFFQELVLHTPEL